MRGLLSLAVVALIAYRSGRDQGETRGFADGVSKMAGAFTAGATRCAD